MKRLNKDIPEPFRLPRITVAAVRGGSGKTVVTLGLVRALKQDGLDVVTFKKGPDYIDAGWMSLASGRPCHNLDPFMMREDTILSSFGFRSLDADLSVMEGNRGLYDGVDLEGSCSTAELSKRLASPVILVVDCTKATRSIAAVVMGFEKFDPSVRIAGVVLNRVAGTRHMSLIRRAVEYYTNVPVLGAVSKFPEDPLPMRHLGLTPADEHPGSLMALDDLADLMRKELDLEAVKKIAGDVPLWNGPVTDPLDAVHVVPGSSEVKPVIGVLRDAAFQFYYPENIEAIERAGGEVLFINAEQDRILPDVDALYIGGGFPETRAEELAANREFMESLRSRAEDGMPIYAECGGLMYLGHSTVWKGRSYPMAGILKWKFITGKRPVGHGYSVIRTVRDTPFFPEDTVIKGHEFHYSRPEPAGDRVDGEDFCSCTVVRGNGFRDGEEGVCRKNVFGTYTHVHVLDNPGWAEGLVRAAVLHGRL